MPRTLYQKLWDAHAVETLATGETLLYIDRHFVHEVTSPQAFDGLRLANRPVRRPDLTFATVDHNIATLAEDRLEIRDPLSKAQVAALESNCRQFGVTYYGVDSERQGIVHVIGPELGLTLPGQTVVCGDSHTSTHGAFGSLAFGIGTSEVEHVLATQTLRVMPSKTFGIEVTGTLRPGVTAKDIILRTIRDIGTGGATRHVIEFYGETVRRMSMAERMTLCNMAIEAGAKAGMVAPDETTFAYIAAEHRPFAPTGADLAARIESWRDLVTDDPASFDRHHHIDASTLEPQITWGTSPGMTTDLSGVVPQPDEVPFVTPADVERALTYMGLTAGQKLAGLPVDVVFIGSCTNSRIEDLRVAAAIFSGQRVAPGVQVLVVPGSVAVKRQAEREGLDAIFRDAGCEWREAGCSMCLGMNPDQLRPGQRAASTSNRNFEGRQGQGGRTHLVSPETAAATALAGHFTAADAWVAVEA